MPKNIFNTVWITESTRLGGNKPQKLKEDRQREKCKRAKEGE